MELENIVEVAQQIWFLHVTRRGHKSASPINDEFELLAQFYFYLSRILKYVAFQLLARYFDPPCTRLMIFAEFTKDLDVGNWAQIELSRVNLQPRSKSLTFLGKET